MEAWQRIGTYAAGLALDSAGIKGNAEILDRTDMIVAAGGGERDLAVDIAILNADAQGQFGAQLSQRTTDERSAADAVPGPAFQPARRQHFDRAWRFRHVADLHGRGSRRRRRDADCTGAHRLRPKRHRAGRRRPQWRAQGPADALRVRRLQSEGQIRAGMGAPGQIAASRLARPARFSSSSPRQHARRAAPSPTPD